MFFSRSQNRFSAGAKKQRGVAIITALLIWRHRSNIRNLMEGKEGKIK